MSRTPASTGRSTPLMAHLDPPIPVLHIGQASASSPAVQRGALTDTTNLPARPMSIPSIAAILRFLGAGPPRRPARRRRVTSLPLPPSASAHRPVRTTGSALVDALIALPRFHPSARPRAARQNRYRALRLRLALPTPIRPPVDDDVDEDASLPDLLDSTDTILAAGITVRHPDSNARSEVGPRILPVPDRNEDTPFAHYTPDGHLTMQPQHNPDDSPEAVEHFDRHGTYPASPPPPSTPSTSIAPLPTSVLVEAIATWDPDSPPMIQLRYPVELVYASLVSPYAVLRHLMTGTALSLQDITHTGWVVGTAILLVEFTNVDTRDAFMDLLYTYRVTDSPPPSTHSPTPTSPS